jgi:hypothetical protein
MLTTRWKPWTSQMRKLPLLLLRWKRSHSRSKSLGVISTTALQR